MRFVSRIRPSVQLLLWVLFVVVLAIGYLAAQAGSDEFDWTVSALAATAFATLLLAMATYALAREAIEERRRRPRLTLSWDSEKRDSIPAIKEVRVRLRVHNAPGLRAAQGTRVLVDRCVEPDGEPMTFGSPALRWMGTRPPQEDEPVVVFAGAWRVVTLGTLVPRRPWVLTIGLVGGRDSFGTGTTFRLIVGSDDADARFYDVVVGWNESGDTVEAVLGSLAVTVEPTTPARGLG